MSNPLRVHDELRDGYVFGTVMGSAGCPDWRVVPGKPAPILGSAFDFMVRAATRYGLGGDGTAAVHWSRDTFPADQYAEIAHDPLRMPNDALCAGVSVRQDPASDSCYAMFVRYYGAFEYGGGEILRQWVYRINAGVWTLLAQFDRPGWTWADDWWFGQLQVWGQSPVHLRVLNKAPTSYIPGSWKDSSFLPMWAEDAGAGRPASALAYTQSLVYPAAGWTAQFVAPENSGAVWYDAAGARTSPGNAWIVWEGTDASASRLAAGQPGFRWGGETSYSVAKFTAGELRADGTTPSLFVYAEPQAGGARLYGTRAVGSTVTVTGG